MGREDLMPDEKPLTYDLQASCPLARWRSDHHRDLGFGIESLQDCALISDGGSQPFSWAYRVTCAVARRQFWARLDSREECVEDVVHWLQFVNCPGHILPRPE